MKSLMVAILLMVGMFFSLMLPVQAQAGLISLGEYSINGLTARAVYHSHGIVNFTGLPFCPLQIGDAIMEADCPKYTVGMQVFLEFPTLNKYTALFFMIDCTNGMYQGASVYFTQGITTGPFSPPAYAARGTLAGDAKLVGCRFIHKRAH